MGRERRPLARLHKHHGKGKRAVSQLQSHLANLRRELRDRSKRDALDDLQPVNEREEANDSDAAQ